MRRDQPYTDEDIIRAREAALRFEGISYDQVEDMDLDELREIVLEFSDLLYTKPPQARDLTSDRVYTIAHRLHYESPRIGKERTKAEFDIGLNTAKLRTAVGPTVDFLIENTEAIAEREGLNEENSPVYRSFLDKKEKIEKKTHYAETLEEKNRQRREERAFAERGGDPEERENPYTKRLKETFRKYNEEHGLAQPQEEVDEPEEVIEETVVEEPIQEETPKITDADLEEIRERRRKKREEEQKNIQGPKYEKAKQNAEKKGEFWPDLVDYVFFRLSSTHSLEGALNVGFPRWIKDKGYETSVTYGFIHKSFSDEFFDARTSEVDSSGISEIRDKVTKKAIKNLEKVLDLEVFSYENGVSDRKFNLSLRD